jgi:hypothetical protein
LDTSRKIATTVGVLFITGTVAGVLSVVATSGLFGTPIDLKTISSDASRIEMGALLVLVMGLALAVVPVVIFPILRRQNQTLAIGYVVFRGALETAGTLGIVICWLLLVEVAQQHAAAGAQSQVIGDALVKATDPIAGVSAIVFSLGAMMLYDVLYTAALIPRWISGWGLIAAVSYLVGGLAALFGASSDLWYMPMLPQEMVMAVWLIVKGFSPAAITSGSDHPDLVTVVH